jgi:hypothetical protein
MKPTSGYSSFPNTGFEWEEWSEVDRRRWMDNSILFWLVTEPDR